MLTRPGSQLRVAEYEAELYYGLHFPMGLGIRPNLQYVANPSGLAASAGVIVFGIKSVLNF
jgi:carbohydrate-selective porin OprB